MVHSKHPLGIHHLCRLFYLKKRTIKNSAQTAIKVYTAIEGKNVLNPCIDFYLYFYSWVAHRQSKKMRVCWQHFMGSSWILLPSSRFLFSIIIIVSVGTTSNEFIMFTAGFRCECFSIKRFQCDGRISRPCFQSETHSHRRCLCEFLHSCWSKRYKRGDCSL